MEKGLTVGEVADHLRLGADVIEDLETDDYSRLPGSTFVKGYLRSYARLLDLDGEELVGGADLEPEPAPIAGIDPGGKVSGRRIRFRTRRRRSGRRVLRRALLLLVFGGLVAGGLTLLPQSGISRISDQIASRWSALGEWAGFPGKRDNEPARVLPGSDDGQDTSPGQSAGALIRLE